MIRSSPDSSPIADRDAEAAPAGDPVNAIPAPGLPDIFIQSAAVVLAVTTIALLIRSLLGGQPAHLNPVVQVLLALATVAGVCWGAWQRYRLWSSPVRELGKIVEQVHQGEL